MSATALSTSEWMVEHGFTDAQAIADPKPTTPNIEHLIDALEIALSDWTRQMKKFAEEVDYVDERGGAGEKS